MGKNIGKIRSKTYQNLQNSLPKYGEYVLLASEVKPVLEKVHDLLLSLEDRAHGEFGDKATELRRDVEKLLKLFRE